MKHKKKAILLKAVGGENWIGGLYYIRNILYQLLNNDGIKNDYSINVYISEKYKELFGGIKGDYKVIVSKYNYGIKEKLELFFLIIKLNVKFVYPMHTNLNWIGVKSVDWIPDFQHRFYPEFFNEDEIKRRDLDYTCIAKSNCPLVLSSNTAKFDFDHFYPNIKKNVFVVPFVSYIEDIIIEQSIEREQDVLKKYELNGKKYTVVMNQFWRHKNHIVVLNAMKIFYQKNPNSDLILVFTGKIRNDIDTDYFNNLKKLMNDELLIGRLYMLGFISREEQIVVMKNAQFVIQPSLFEGWGTVVEDAKVLDKTILLSDIPVHSEQMNSKCILFDPQDSQKLADLIEQENAKEHHDDIEAGIADMKARAKEYSKGIQELLEL